jgi:hypothetical protein
VSGATVTFENGEAATPTASNVIVVNTTDHRHDNRERWRAPRNRIWDVRVSIPDGSSGVLVDGFTVIP